jgi:hypothetical protein
MPVIGAISSIPAIQLMMGMPAGELFRFEVLIMQNTVFSLQLNPII